MSDAIGGLLGVAVFGTLAVFARPFARRTIRAQNRAWGMHLRPDQEGVLAWFTRAICVVGLGFAVALLMQAGS